MYFDVWAPFLASTISLSLDFYAPLLIVHILLKRLSERDYEKGRYQKIRPGVANPFVREVHFVFIKHGAGRSIVFIYSNIHWYIYTDSSIVYTISGLSISNTLVSSTSSAPKERK